MKQKIRHCGFTLVEIIVTGVIVAVLALISVQIYRGYIDEARQGVVDGIGASACKFLQGAGSIELEIPNPPNITTELTEGQHWTTNLPSGEPVVFSCPRGMTITIDEDRQQVRAVFGSFSSEWYSYTLP
ncbi:MAG: prepilin-type N-terminal cleavage/methylation domain-containing protein [Chitinispirillaceae bacterium]|nr:prepilin-type N-terminal cleavage/methylation domain-containing protein [Chitinispirillaceae bacterium]